MRYKVLLMSLLLVLVLPVLAPAQQVIDDPTPYNLQYPNSPGWTVAVSLYRDVSASANLIGAYSGGGSGYFYMLNAFVVLNTSANPLLTNLNQVTSVIVTRVLQLPGPPPTTQDDPNELTLNPTYTNWYWLGSTGSLFNRNFRMEGWEYGVDWRFVMTYTGTDGLTHRQTTLLNSSTLPSPSPVPLPIHSVRFQKDQVTGLLSVTWPAAGNPLTTPGNPFIYRVRVMDVTNGNFVAEIRGLGDPLCPGSTTWCFSGGTYNDQNNLVTFPIPSQFIGLPYALRLEYEFGHRTGGTPYWGGSMFSRSELYVVAPAPAQTP